MPTHVQVKNQIDAILRYLVETSLADDQQFPLVRRRSGVYAVTFKGAEYVSIAMKDREYKEIYDYLVGERAYNVKLLDGAVIQMMYVFNGNGIQRHRLAFFPSPYLENFQNDPEIYLEDEIYSDVIARNLVPFPLRFDFDGRDGIYEEIVHPKSHLTLGQYEKCRIPVTAPLTPYWFISFILRNFYNTAYNRYSENLPVLKGVFAESIFATERDLIHIQLPG